ncbi:MAG: Mur ligase family protein [Candidatus Zixiibacteriota bacterium]|jgi:dihydrofolate synthase/folylpolyglutamate synthase
MDYAEATAFLNSLINYERVAPRQYDTRAFDLEQFAALLGRLGSPHDAYPIIHVAGTKGKGSVVAMLAAAFGAAGFRAGTFTSPHLRSPRERVALGDEMITPEDFGRFVAAARAAMTGGEAANYRTYFETLLAAALLYFRERNADVAILEAGLGGRLDATNVVTPAVAVLTTVDLDHTDILGETLEKIAAEKAGVIKAAVPAVSTPQDPAAEEVIRRFAAKARAPLAFVGSDIYFHENSDGTFDYRGPRYNLVAVKPATPGHGARVNAAAALAALECFTPFDVPAESARRGVEAARPRGRVEFLAGSPPVLLDTSHTPASGRELANVAGATPGDVKVLVWGMSADKDAAAYIRELAGAVDVVIATAASLPRARPAEELATVARGSFGRVEAVTPPAAALARARELAGPAGLVVVAGSFYLAGEILTEIEGPLE